MTALKGETFPLTMACNAEFFTMIHFRYAGSLSTANMITSHHLTLLCGHQSIRRTFVGYVWGIHLFEFSIFFLNPLPTHAKSKCSCEVVMPTSYRGEVPRKLAVTKCTLCFAHAGRRQPTNYDPLCRRYGARQSPEQSVSHVCQPSLKTDNAEFSAW